MRIGTSKSKAANEADADFTADELEAGRQAGAMSWYIGVERRAHRRHDLDHRDIPVNRVGRVVTKGKPVGTKGKSVGTKGTPVAMKGKPLGQLVDISAGGLRVRTKDKTARVGSKIQVSIELPTFAGISAFVDHSGNKIRPKREWTGQLTVVRVRDFGDVVELGARLENLDELDRGMLALYLSTQPLAA